MPKRKGIIYATIERLNGLMALKESRYEAKKALRASGEHVWSFSTGKIHSLTTRGVYQQHILKFVSMWTLAAVPTQCKQNERPYGCFSAIAI